MNHPKQLIKFFPFLLIGGGIVGVITPVLAEEPSYNPILGKTILIPKKSGGNLNPHAPSRVYIECTYTTGSLTFVLPPSIYSTTVDLSNDGYSWSGFVTRDQPTLEIPDLEGTYTIRCNADDGKTYIGTLEF